MTKIQTEIRFLCDGCPADLTGRSHLRIVINHLAGKRIPPFHGPFPEIPIGCRDMVLHGCDGECLGRAIERMIKEAAAQPLKSAIDVHVVPVAVTAKRHSPSTEDGIMAVVTESALSPRVDPNKGFPAVLRRIFTLGL